MKSWLKLVVLTISLLGISSAYAWKDLTVVKSDTLTTIADKYRPTGVSRMDMVIAIRNSNPRVFSKAANFKPGVQLVLPTTALEVRSAIKGKVPATSSASGSAASKANLAKTSVPVQTKASASAPSSAPQAKPVVKKTTSSAAVAASQTSMTIKSLQDTVSSQTQTIEDNQTQINQLTGQLNIANQQVQSLQAEVSHQGIWTLGNLWLVLWLLTLIMFLFQYRKNKQLLDYYDDHYDQDHHDEREEEDDEASSLNNHRYDEPALVEEVRGHEVAVGERYEPQLDLGEVRKSRSKSENWEQVELDIPIVEHQSILENGEQEEHTNAFERYDDQTLAGEQNDIIQALSQDADNMQWHQALLEFYVKTNSQNGFKRHYQNMVKSGLMTEGDPLWEEVRKMYLNKWIYQAV